MAKIKTVNVVEIIGGVIASINSFTADDEGKVEAETLFGNLIHQTLIQHVETDHPIIAETIVNCLKDGY